MEEKDKILLAQNWMRQLANGVNPLNGSALKDDDVVNNVHISRCLFYVAELLGQVAELKAKANSARNIPFNLSSMQVEKYIYTDHITISAFARELEKLIPENMKSVSYKSMVAWLIQQGLLVESEPDADGRTYKIATEKGSSIGIYTEERERSTGHFLVTMYNRDAQKYLLDHITEISQITINS